MRSMPTCFVISPMGTCASLAYRLGRGSIDRPPRRQILRQQAPRAARPHDIEDAVDDLAHRPLARPARCAGLRQVRRDHAPLRVGQIGLVSRDGAAMLLSSGWCPHGESKVGWRNPLESWRAPRLNCFKKCRSQEPGDESLTSTGGSPGSVWSSPRRRFATMRSMPMCFVTSLGLPLGARLKLLRAVAALSTG